jgi:transcriptional regulator with XRE-family HTH domain
MVGDMPDALPIFAANLRRARIAQGLSQEALAHAADLNMTHVARIERAEREPGVRTIAKLTEALGVSAAVLFEGVDGA